MSNELVITNYDELQKRAIEIAKSSLIPVALRNKPADVAIILMQGAELGMAPLQALNSINVIQGKPTLGSEGGIALIRSKAPEAFIKIEMEPQSLLVKCTMAPSKERMDESFTSIWDMARAKEMGLVDKDNYKKQPLTMLKWRAVGEAARTVFPHILKGLKLDAEIDVPAVEEQISRVEKIIQPAPQIEEIGHSELVGFDEYRIDWEGPNHGKSFANLGFHGVKDLRAKISAYSLNRRIEPDQERFMQLSKRFLEVNGQL